MSWLDKVYRDINGDKQIKAVNVPNGRYRGHCMGPIGVRIYCDISVQDGKVTMHVNRSIPGQERKIASSEFIAPHLELGECWESGAERYVAVVA